MSDALVGEWVDALLERHTASLSRRELLKSIRALSARYVERRAALPRRSPIDSAGKRAAFATFYAPLHYLTVRELLRALGGPAPPSSLTDLGCGTGVSAAAWAGESTVGRTDIAAVDQDAWAVAETRWNFRTLGVRGRGRRADMVRTVTDLATSRTRVRSARSQPRGLVAAWSVNEIPSAALPALRDAFVTLMTSGTTVLIVEPLARTASPWWDDWAAAFARVGARADEWRFDTALPTTLADLNDAAGFRRRELSARSLFCSSTG